MAKKPAKSRYSKPGYRRAIVGSNVLAVGDRIVPLLFEKNGRARRIIIRLDHGGGIVVVLPARATKEDGRRFALSNKGWIQERLAHMPEPLPFLHGVTIPFLGVAHLRQLNHSSRFWRLTDTLTDHMERARLWLVEHGPGLHRYGKPAEPLP